MRVGRFGYDQVQDFHEHSTNGKGTLTFPSYFRLLFGPGHYPCVSDFDTIIVFNKHRSSAQSLGPRRFLLSDNFRTPRSDQPHSRFYAMRYQQSGLRVALPLIDCRVFDDVAVGTRQGLDKQASLIASVDSDIELASRIQIHLDFLSPTASWAMGACGPARALGYYIPGERMHQVVDACQRTHGILHAPIGRFRCLYQRRMLSDTKCVETSDPCCYSFRAGKDF